MKRLLLISVILVMLPVHDARMAPISPPARPLRVAACIYAPFVMQKDGQITGFDVDLLDLVCRMEGLDYQITIMSFQDTLEAVRTDRADMAIGCIYITPERKKLFHFTRPILHSGLVLAIDTDSQITSLDDLIDHRLGVKRGATGESLARTWRREGHHISVSTFDSTLDSFKALQKKQIDAALNDYYNTVFLIQSEFAGDITIAENMWGTYYLSHSEIAYPVASNRTVLLQTLDQALSELNGTVVFDNLYRKWFTVSPPLDWRTYIPFMAVGLLILLGAGAGFSTIRRHRFKTRTLRASENHFRTLIMDLPYAVVVTREGQIVLANKKALQLLDETGQPPSGGKRLQDYFRQAPLPPLFTPEPAAPEPNSPDFPATRLLTPNTNGALGELEWIRRDGKKYQVSITRRQVAWHNRPAEQLIIQDLTAFLTLQQEQTLLKEQLAHAQKMEAIGQMAGGIAHDFNNLLTGIHGCTELIRTHSTDPEIREQTRYILEASRRAADLTSKLLAFARKARFQITPVRVHDILDEILALIQHTFPRNIRIQRRFTATQDTVQGDSGQLHQIFMNLAINARDAMPAGGELFLTTSTRDLDSRDCLRIGEIEPGSYLTIEVKDTGEGIDPTHLNRIFDPFFTTKPRGKGTGLGLSVVYSAVRGHAGAVEVTSQPGDGTTFRVFLPLTDSVSTTEPVTTPQSRPEADTWS